MFYLIIFCVKYTLSFEFDYFDLPQGYTLQQKRKSTILYSAFCLEILGLCRNMYLALKIHNSLRPGAPFNRVANYRDSRAEFVRPVQPVTEAKFDLSEK